MQVFDPQVFTVRPALGAGRASSGRDRSFSNVRWTAPIVRGPKRPRGAKRAGLLFERKVIDVLAAIYGTSFTPAPTIQYSFRGKPKAAILDGLLRLEHEVLIIEVKLAHTERVWEQLMLRYLPLVRALEKGRQIRTIEICRSYDPAVVLPGPHTLIESLHRRPLLERGAAAKGLEVLQWRI